MAASPYPMGTIPQQFFGGGINRSKFQPYSGNVGGGFKAGGVIFAGGPLQNYNLFDSTFGILGYPYLGQHNQYNENKPVQQINPGMGFGVTQALPGGNFATMVANQYVMLTFNSQLAGIATSVLKSPGSSYRKSQNNFIGWINSTTYWKNSGLGFYMLNGLPVSPTISRDQVNTETLTGYANPGKLTYWIGAPAAKVDSYKTKTD